MGRPSLTLVLEGNINNVTEKNQYLQTVEDMLNSLAKLKIEKVTVISKFRMMDPEHIWGQPPNNIDAQFSVADFEEMSGDWITFQDDEERPEFNPNLDAHRFIITNQRPDVCEFEEPSWVIPRVVTDYGAVISV